MEVLDTSIANVALPHIAGGLSASADESTWVLTSYLVSNAIMFQQRRSCRTSTRLGGLADCRLPRSAAVPVEETKAWRTGAMAVHWSKSARVRVSARFRHANLPVTFVTHSDAWI